MALYNTELAAEAMREKASSAIERAKQTAAVAHERERAAFLAESAGTAEAPAIRSGVLERLSRKELYQRAKQQGVQGRSKMSKKQLADVVRHAW